MGLNKGGVFKLFQDNKLLVSDTHFSLLLEDGGKIKNAVGHLVSKNNRIQLEADEIMIEGSLGWAKQKQMTPFNLVVLRLIMFTVGRFNPDAIRKILQKILITGKKPAPFTFRRQLKWVGDHWLIRDELYAKSWEGVTAAAIGCDQTSIYVVMSRTFQAGQLQPWLDCTKQVKSLQPGQPLVIERALLDR